MNYNHLYLCACIFCLHVCLCTSCAQDPWKPEESVGYPETGATVDCTTMWCWEADPDSAELLVLLGNEPSLQYLKRALITRVCLFCVSLLVHTSVLGTYVDIRSQLEGAFFFFSYTTWASRIKPRPSDLVASALSH